MTNEFSVYQFFTDDTYEAVRRFVPLREAMDAAIHYCTSVAARTGITTRVIITDGGDSTVFEWRYGEGVVWPPQARASALPNPFLEGDPS